MSATTQVDAKAYLLAALRTALPDVQVEWSHPGKTMKSEALFFLSTQPYEQEARSLGMRSRAESYTLPLCVSVSRKGNDPETVERRCVELLTSVADTLRADPTLGGLVRSAQFRAAPVDNYSGTAERVSESVARIEVEAEVAF